ncbi:MAG: fructose-bisphosphate aldolase [Candidatus Latescibacteria bacterium]|nr:fructose-bisphosphate aldolase [Candidatus Latescibacterota bacterium]
MSMGKDMRMARLFGAGSKSKRMVLVTMDHGICISPMMEISNPAKVIQQIVEGGADAMLLTPGIAKCAYKELVGKASLIVRIDGTATSIGPDLTNDELIYSVEGASSLGADAVATFGVIGVSREAQLSQKIARVSEDCDEWGMPHLVEMCPDEMLRHQFTDRAKREWPSDPELVKYHARVAAELGADIVKGYYTGDPKTFREVIEYCPVPYAVLGGPASSDPEVFLKFIREAMDCGARGVCLGRNVWTYKDPTALTKAVCRIVHDDTSAEEALKEIK